MSFLANWLRRLARRPVKPPDPFLDPINKGLCPDCGCEQWYEGPSGGMSTNWCCVGCGCRLNVCGWIRPDPPHAMRVEVPKFNAFGKTSGVMFAERI